MGAYTYQKRLPDRIERVRVMVYMLEVEKKAASWPEQAERERQWVSTKEAAKRVGEPGLTDIIKRLDVQAIDAS